MPSEVHEIYKTRLIGLLDLRGTRDEYGKEQEHVLEMTTDARAVFRRFQEEIEPQLAEYGDLGHMTDWGGKLVGAVGRIAGLLHLAKTPTCYAPEKTPVALDTVEAAISIGRYLIAHAKLAYGDMGADEEVDDARYLLGFIRSRDLESFTASALHRSLRNGRFHSPEQLTLAIQKLEDHGLVRQIPQEKRPRGRNPSFAFAVSPFAHRKAPEEC